MPDAPPPSAAADPQRSPLRSLLSVVAGWLVLWVAGGLYAAMLSRFAAAHYAGERPSDVGLALLLAGALPNGVVGGLVTGRVAGFAPVAHAAVLAGLVGFFALMSSDQARGMPWWFAVGRAVVPGACIVIGGGIARLVAPRPKGRR